MPSRFTQTEKWDDKWFRQLSPNAKVLYWYIWDKCNIAGFWEVDLEGARFHTGIQKRSMVGAYKELARGFEANGDYIWVRRFLYHQRNLPLNENNPSHKGIIKVIKEYKSIFPNVLSELEKQSVKEQKKGATKELSSSLSKGIGIGIGISKSISKSKKEEKFENFWKIYPKKVGKGKAEESFLKISPNDELFERMIKAVEAQKKSDQWKKDGGQYIPNPATWLNQKRWGDELPHKETTAEQFERMKREGAL